MKTQHFILLLLLTVFLPLKAKGHGHGKDELAGYVMVYHKDADHGLHMAYSWDGYIWTALNEDRPVMAGDTIAAQHGIRDPYIFRNPKDGSFCVAMTDLHVFGQRDGVRSTRWERPDSYGWGNNRGLVLLRSEDLIHWKRSNLDFSELTCTDSIIPNWKEVGCVWAPEMNWDEQRQQVMLHFTTRYKNGRNVIYYAYMNDDFTELASTPRFLYGKQDKQGKFTAPTIDSDITRIGDTYHLLMVQFGFVKHATSPNLTGPYVEDNLYNDGEPQRHEAPAAWRRIGTDEYVIMYDNYSREPHNFGFVTTRDFKTFHPIGYFDSEGSPMRRTNFSEQKHGAVVAVTRDELETLIAHWNKERPYPMAVLPGDYPDPTILRDGNDYYMTHSPFYYKPGFLIWHSRDLMHWQPIGCAATDWQGSAMAPDLQRVGDTYYIYYPAAGTNWVMTAKDIRGPWSKPTDLGIGGIDPGLVVTPEGKRYLFTSNGQVTPLTSDGLARDGQTETVYQGWEYPASWRTECMCLESPKLIYREPYYYMISAEGGTAGPATSHMVVAARSKSIMGPWENSPHNPIVHTYSGAEEWWSKGHGSLVEGPNGQWWIIYHAYLRNAHALGRQTLIEPIEWTPDGWFRSKETISDPTTPSFEPYKGWMGWKEDITSMAHITEDKVILPGRGSNPSEAHLALTTATDTTYTVEVRVTPGKGNDAGLLLFYNEKAYAGITTDGRELTLYEPVAGTEAPRTTQQSISAVTKKKRVKTIGLRLVNGNGRLSIFIHTENEGWTPLRKDIDVSHLHHNNYHGFYALRPALCSLKKGRAAFSGFTYQASEE